MQTTFDPTTLTTEDWMALQSQRNKVWIQLSEGDQEVATYDRFVNMGLMSFQPANMEETTWRYWLIDAGRAALAAHFPPAVVLEYRYDTNGEKDAFERRASELVQAGYKAVGYTAGMSEAPQGWHYMVVTALFVLSDAS